MASFSRDSGFLVRLRGVSVLVSPSCVKLKNTTWKHGRAESSFRALLAPRILHRHFSKRSIYYGQVDELSLRV